MEVEKKRFYYSFVFPVVFVLFIWLVWLLDLGLDLDLSKWGIYPRTLKGLPGILTSPFIHANWNHVIDNTIPFLVLAIGLFYFYRDLAARVFLLTYVFTGLMVWIGARPAYHIGASGLIYALASFLFFSGIIRRYIPLMALSLLVVFLYGSLVWGILPLKEEVSWESHLLGGVAGWLFAILFRNRGPQRPVYEWELEPEEEEYDEEYWNQVLDEKLEKKKKKKKRGWWDDPFS